MPWSVLKLTPSLTFNDSKPLNAMPLDTKPEDGVEIPPKWKKCVLRNCPYYLTLEGYQPRFWDEVYLALQRTSDSFLEYKPQGPCKRPCEMSGPTSPHDIALRRGKNADDTALKEIINKLVISMPQIEVSWE